MIFATAYAHQNPAFELSQKYPDVIFEHVGGWDDGRQLRQYLWKTTRCLVHDGRCSRNDDQDQ